MRLQRFFLQMLLVCLVWSGWGVFPQPGRSEMGLPPYSWNISRVPEAMQHSMIGVSWHQGCPVPLSELRIVTVRYVDFHGKAQQGRLMVHNKIAQDAAMIFGELYTNRFPIEKMNLIETYDGNDDLSMSDNNTSAFNCRVVSGTRVFSRHAYGRAIDINPVQNPFLKKGHVSPPQSLQYVDRTQDVPGMIHRNDAVWRAFVGRQWTWGGSWKSVKDYQHFEKKE